MSILLVEDSLIDARMIGTYLSDWGLDYISVESGSEAWDLLQAPDGPPFGPARLGASWNRRH